MVVFVQSAVETRPVEPRTQIISGSVDSLTVLLISAARPTRHG